MRGHNPLPHHVVSGCHHVVSDCLHLVSGWRRDGVEDYSLSLSIFFGGSLLLLLSEYSELKRKVGGSIPSTHMLVFCPDTLTNKNARNVSQKSWSDANTPAMRCIVGFFVILLLLLGKLQVVMRWVQRSEQGTQEKNNTELSLMYTVRGHIRTALPTRRWGKITKTKLKKNNIYKH